MRSSASQSAGIFGPWEYTYDRRRKLSRWEGCTVTDVVYDDGVAFCDTIIYVGIHLIAMRFVFNIRYQDTAFPKPQCLTPKAQTRHVKSVEAL